MSALLIARFEGDIEELKRSYDRAHALIMSRGGATSFGELRHHCAVGDWRRLFHRSRGHFYQR